MGSVTEAQHHLRISRSSNLNLFVLSLSMFHVSTNTIFGHTHSVGTVFKTYDEGSALQGYVIDTFSIPTLLECELTCAALLPTCKSFNYKKDQDGLNTCEISSSVRVDALLEDFVKDENAIYVEVETAVEEVFRDELWTLIARFSNKDGKNWMEDQGTWWFTREEAYGNTLDPSHNGDMISKAFWLQQGSELKITRSDDPTHTALLTTAGNCLQGMSFRCKMASYGVFRGSVSWASDKCLGSCSVDYGGNFTVVKGFSQSQCEGDLQSSDKIGFWCDYHSGDGAILMIGGGGKKLLAC